MAPEPRAQKANMHAAQCQDTTTTLMQQASISSDFDALDLRFRQFTPEGVTFRIPVLTKTRRSGPPKEAFFSKFADDEALYPVETMKVYEILRSLLLYLSHSGNHTNQCHQLQ